MIARLARPEDVATWLEFLRVYEAAIVRYCRTRGLQEADAEEVCQDVVLALSQRAGEWETTGRPGSFRAWLFETARRICLKRIRDRRDYASVDDAAEQVADSAADVVELLTRQEDDDHRNWLFCAAAGAVQAEVEDVTWQAFWQTAVESQSPSFVAVELGIGVGSVYAARCRVMARIRRCVAELEGGASDEVSRSKGDSR